MQVVEDDDMRCVCQECWRNLKPDMPFPQMDVSLTFGPFVVLTTTHNTVLQGASANGLCLRHADVYYLKALQNCFTGAAELSDQHYQEYENSSEQSTDTLAASPDQSWQSK